MTELTEAIARELRKRPRNDQKPSVSPRVCADAYAHAAKLGTGLPVPITKHVPTDETS